MLKKLQHFRFRYLSDGTELTWSQMHKNQGLELCVIAQTVKYDTGDENGWKDVWNAFQCIRIAQVICQEHSPPLLPLAKGARTYVNGTEQSFEIERDTGSEVIVRNQRFLKLLSPIPAHNAAEEVGAVASQSLPASSDVSPTPEVHPTYPLRHSARVRAQQKRKLRRNR